MPFPTGLSADRLPLGILQHDHVQLAAGIRAPCHFGVYLGLLLDHYTFDDPGRHGLVCVAPFAGKKDEGWGVHGCLIF